MLKKQNRLAKIAKKSTGKFFTSSSFTIKIYTNGENLLRFGFVVSKKISKKAVVRNKTKRVLRSVVEDLIRSMEANNDIIVYAKKQLDFSQKQTIKVELINIFKQAKILK